MEPHSPKEFHNFCPSCPLFLAPAPSCLSPGLSLAPLVSRRPPYELLGTVEKLNKNNGITKEERARARGLPAITFIPGGCLVNIMADQAAKRQPRPVAKYIVADIVPARFHYYYSPGFVSPCARYGIYSRYQSILINGGPYLVDRGGHDRSTMGLRGEFTPLGVTLP